MTITLGKRIAFACGVPVALAVGMGAVAMFGVGRLGEVFQSVDRGALPGSIQLAELSRAGAEQEKDMLKHMLAAGAPDAQARFESELAAWETRFQNGLQNYGNNVADAGAHEALDRIRQTHQRFLSEWTGTIEPLSRTGDAKSAFAKWGAEMVPAIEAERSAIESGLQAQRQSETRTAQAAAAVGQSLQLWLIVLLIVAAAGGGGLAWLAAGSLKRVLLKVVNDLCRGAGQVASAANQISSSSQSLAQGTSEQAASLEETSASTEEMTSMTRKNAENAEDCAKLMAAVDTRIAQANRTLGEMVDSMEQINASSDKISKIIKVIEEIAFQTNILALNAAVEAARAGEAGMGFAVVADEVRNLAQRSSQAAKDTAVLIEESIAKSNGGTAKVSQVAEAIQAITESANKVKLLADEVNLGSQEQARGMAQIAKAVVEIEQVTQRAAAGSEETASASEELSAQAEAIRGLVEGIRELAGGGDRTHTRKPLARRRAAERESPRHSRQAVPTRADAPARNEPSAAADLDGHFEPAYAVAEAEPEARIGRGQIPLEGDFKEF